MLVVLVCIALAGSAAAQIPEGLPSQQGVAVLMHGASTQGGGMQILDATLENAFPGTLRSRVYDPEDKPVDFVRDVTDVNIEDQRVILVGHSTGGREALDFAERQLRNARIRVDLLVQIDRAASAASVPPNVREAYHFWEPPQRWQEIEGGRDVDVSALFGDDSIDHKSIDNDPRLHAMIVWLANRSFRPNRVNLQMRLSPRERRYEGNFLRAVAESGDWPTLCYEARDELTVAGPLEREIGDHPAGGRTDFIVFSGVDLSLRAGHDVVLRPGFSALPGSEVSIGIGRCPG